MTAANEVTDYTFRPSLLGAPRAFKLTEHAIEWTAGAKSGRVPYRDVFRVRLSFRPVSMQSQRFVAEIWSHDAPTLQIVSSSWKSMVEQERLDRPYTAFVIALHRRLVRAGATVAFEQGSAPLFYWPGLALFVVVMLALAALIARAIEAKAYSGAAFIGVFFAAFAWQAGNYFRRNKPGRYAPDALPADLMPTI